MKLVEEIGEVAEIINIRAGRKAGVNGTTSKARTNNLYEKGVIQMKIAFMGSLCHHGIIGGGIYVTDEAISFRTQKITVEEADKNINIPYSDIKQIKSLQVGFLFPAVTIERKDKSQCKLIVFKRKKFLRMIKEVYTPMK